MDKVRVIEAKVKLLCTLILIAYISASILRLLIHPYSTAAERSNLRWRFTLVPVLHDVLLWGAGN